MSVIMTMNLTFTDTRIQKFKSQKNCWHMIITTNFKNKSSQVHCVKCRLKKVSHYQLYYGHRNCIIKHYIVSTRARVVLSECGGFVSTRRRRFETITRAECGSMGSGRSHKTTQIALNSTFRANERRESGQLLNTKFREVLYHKCWQTHLIKVTLYALRKMYEWSIFSEC